MKKLFFVFASIVLTSASFATRVTTHNVQISNESGILKMDVPPTAVLASFQSVFGNVPVR